ncbi:ATPase [Vibrio phage 1.224.A._10N.261.48.B1]|nr:ATPase [Vibrio phage 1.169.O._10N.261.52.B1]YP_009817664.1 ATPase [Vibrio phage 1.224.A._10N.261.48.B1]AUR92083.1 hypothetical protein NVP1169O_55 [Vibrio phage 1.169.O._10N.261.52.B1]AUR96431.1 hypothetical protein NVP1224A_64 [Vibrio phage 1.224.A._10N.261.48.B1]
MFKNLPTTRMGDLYSQLLVCLKAHEPFIIHGDPAIGKSALAQQLADNTRLKMIDMRCSTKSNEDFEGLINFNEDKTKATYVPLETLPLDDQELPVDAKGKPMRGWFLFLDEMRQASPEVLHALYKLINERAVGDKGKLHPKVYIGAASNLASNDNFLTPMPDPMISRMVHFKAIGDFKWWYEGWGQHNLIPVLKDYFTSTMVNGDYEILNNYAQSEKGDIYASERTWEKFNNLARKAKVQTSTDLENLPYNMMAGCIGNMATENLLLWAKSQVSTQSIGVILANDAPDVTDFLVYTDEEMKKVHQSMYQFLSGVSDVEDFLTYYRRIKRIGEEIGQSMLFTNDQIASILKGLNVDASTQMDILLKEQKDGCL